MEPVVIFVILFISAFIIIFILIARRYIRCPADKVLVVYGQVGGGRSSKCYHGGAALVMPIIQDYDFLDLKPISTETSGSFYDKFNFPIELKAEIKIAISTEPAVLQNAAERLLGMQKSDIKNLGTDIIYGTLRTVIAQTDMIEILNDKERLIYLISEYIEHEISKIGLKLVNIHLKDISDKYNVSSQLSKEANKLIRLKEITDQENTKELAEQINDIDQRLAAIEDERTELMKRKIQIISQLQKK